MAQLAGADLAETSANSIPDAMPDAQIQAIVTAVVAALHIRGQNRPSPRPNVKMPTLLSGSSIREFQSWKEKWLAFIELSELTNEDDQKKNLIFAIDDEWRTLVKHTLNKDFSDDGVTSSSIVDVIEKHLKRSQNHLIERKRFYESKQQTGESVDDFYLRLKQVGEFCSFACDNCRDGYYIDQMIRGVRDEETQMQLLQEPSDSLTVKRVLEICRARESAAENCQSLHTGQTNLALMSGSSQCDPRSDELVARKRFPRPQSTEHSGDKRNSSHKHNCDRCGKDHEPSATCPAVRSKCRICGKVGHWQKSKMCSGARRHKDPNGRCKRGVSRLKREFRTMVAQTTKAPKVKLQVQYRKDKEVRSVQMTAVPDTGSESTAMGLCDAERLGISKSRLRRSSAKLYGADGQELTCFGYFAGKVTLGDESVETDIYVVDGLKGMLLSWFHCKQLRILPKEYPQQIQCCQVVSASGARRKPEWDSTKGDPTKEQRAEHWKMMKEAFPAVFDVTTLKPMTGEPMRIPLTEDARPISLTAARSIPKHWEQQIKDQLDDAVRRGIFAPVDYPTPWCHPIVPVRKKTPGEVRLCVDLTQLNRYVKRAPHPFKTPHEAVSAVDPAAKWFSKFDAKNGYWQIPIAEEDQDKTVFISPWGRYKHLRGSMGLVSTGDEYNRRGDLALCGLPDMVKVVDDVLAWSKTYAEHIDNVWAILERCEQHGITLKPDKAQFAAEEVEFVGYRISQNGRTPTAEKVKAILDFPLPRSVTDLRSFMGMVNQLGEFSLEIAGKAEPLRQLLKRNTVWRWDDVLTKHFEDVKACLAEPPVLGHFDPQLYTVLQTDASLLNGVGYALRQKTHTGEWRLIQCGSRFLSDTEKRYAVIEVEMLAIVWSMIKCRLYLAGMPMFNVEVDHKPLVPILNKKLMSQIENPRLQRLREKILDFSFECSYRKGVEHCIPDCLSRYPTSQPDQADRDLEDEVNLGMRMVVLGALSSADVDGRGLKDITLDKVRAAASRDPVYRQLAEAILRGFPEQKIEASMCLRPYWGKKDDFAVEDDLIVCGQRLVIPESLRADVLKELHSSHQGIVKTRARARQTVYWPNIDNDIANVVSSCRQCEKYLPSCPKEPLCQEPTPSRPFEVVSADYFSYAGRCYLIYVDRLTGWPIVYAYNRDPTARDLLKALRETFAATGVPVKMRSDGGPQFRAKRVRDFLQTWGVDWKPSTPYYPQSNGHAEVTVKAVKSLVAKTTKNGDLDCDEFAKGLLEIRNGPRIGGRSPAQILFGRPMRSTVPTHHRAYAAEWQKLAAECDERVESEKQKVKVRYDKTAKPLPLFGIGTWVNVQDQKSGRWEKTGVVVAVGKNRDYLVKLPSGRVLWRNRRFLRRHHSPIHAHTDHRHEWKKEGEEEGMDKVAPVHPKPDRPRRNVRPPRRLEVNPRKKKYDEK